MKGRCEQEDYKALQARSEECLQGYFENKPRYIEVAAKLLKSAHSRGFKKDWEKRSIIALMDYLLTEEGVAKAAAARKKAAWERRNQLEGKQI